MGAMNIGDLVIHCRDGLARISGETTVNDRHFYLVRIVRDESETIYVPVASAEQIIRPIMNKEQAEELIDYMNSIPLEYNKNTKQRRDLFKKKLASGDVKEIGYLFRQYYLYRKKPEETRIGPVDVDMLSYASNNLLDELALTYSLPRDQIQEFIASKMK